MEQHNKVIERAYAERKRSIHRLKAKGWKLERIAKRWGITKQRVSQILREAFE
jgi:transcriptional regulator